MENNREVDINVLVQLYNQRLSTLTNQNVLLEAKIQTLTNDFGEERKKLIEQNIELQKFYDEQNEDKYQKKGKD
tara:strand:- start:257 stop:478 length:222 start_codon:yes stop_codon:yes gene_type:complete